MNLHLNHLLLLLLLFLFLLIFLLHQLEGCILKEATFLEILYRASQFINYRSSPPVTSHLDQLHVALRAQTTNCGSQNPGAPVAVYSRDRDHAEIDAKIDAVDDRSGLQQRQSTGNRDGRVPPLHGTFEDATDFVDGRVGARGGGGGEEGGVPTAVLSTSAPSTSGQGAQLLDIHFNQHYQQPVGDPSQQRHRPSQKGQLQQQQQQHSRKQQQRAHNAELYGQLSATDASSRLSIQSARLGETYQFNSIINNC